jgi:serine protease AprX
MRIRVLSLLILFLLAGLIFASASDRQDYNGPHIRVLAHGNFEALLAKGCIDRGLPIHTAHALDCPGNTNFSGSDVSVDVEVHSMDLASDNQVRANLVWPNYTGAGRTVAVLDTGINYNHPELASSYAGGKDFVNNDSDPMDDNGHGSHVAGIITGDGVSPNAKGVAPGAKILSGKVLDASGSGSISNIIAAIYWASDNASVDVISMSLGTSTVFKNSNCDSYIPDLTTAINYAVAHGKVVVAAAGNSPNGVSSPGCISSVVAAGAVDSHDTIASFSGRGFSMRDHGVVAPSVNIFSAWTGASYATASGTSMATPMVSGTIALMKQKNPSLTVSKIKSILYSTSKDLGSRGYDTTYGHGRIDAYSAVRAS